MFKKIWNSPTLTTWLSYSTQLLNIFGILPLVLKNFTPGDTSIWYLFTTIISLQYMADFGFRQTFSRTVSYAFGGATDISTFSSAQTFSIATTFEPNKVLLNRIVVVMRYIYLRLTVGLFILMSVFGTWAMAKPISQSSSHSQAWSAWIVVLFVSCISFWGKMYLNFMEGLYKIAVVRRVEIFTSLGSMLTCIAVLLFRPSLLNLVIANQFWILVVAGRDWYLCTHTENGLYKSFVKLPFDRELFLKIWQSAWRSGISGFLGFGLTNLAGIVYAQVATSVEVASFLLAQRLIDQIKVVSMAPVYSNIPLLARLRVQNNMAKFTKIVKKSMLISHAVFVTGFICVGLFSKYLLTLIHSHVPFVPQLLWIFLGLAYFIHRYGAMHMQVYLTTNHVISHIADGVSGLIYVISAIVLSKFIGVYAIPTAMIMGYLGFYSWYAAIYSYRSINTGFWKLERDTVALPFLMLVLYVVYQVAK
ncbi:MAG TPA: hypothetical protein VHB48_07480 [Chitinophagaceae bacterium]|nr:hypothetical protein [Chitinophagaceae bacterium]